MRWFLILALIPLLLLTWGCPGNNNPTSPGKPTPTPTVTMTPTATCVGGSSLGGQTNYSTDQNVQMGQTKMFASPITVGVGINTADVQGFFYNKLKKQDVQFAIYDDSTTSKVTDTAIETLPVGSGFGVQFGVPLITPLGPGVYWLAVIIHNGGSSDLGAGLQSTGDVWDYTKPGPATIGNFPASVTFSHPVPTSDPYAIWVDVCP